MARPFDLITFDFDGVLLHNDYNEQFFDSCRALGLTWDSGREPHLMRYVHDYYGSGHANADLKEHGREGFWLAAVRRFLGALEVEGEIDEVVAPLTRRMREVEVTSFYESGTHELLERLRDEGYRLAMLTNRDDRILEDGAEWDLIEPFELIGTRDTVGKPKPEPDLFLHIGAHFDVPPQRSLHVGDNPYADVLGARAAGWHCLLIDPDDLFPDWEVPRLPTLRDMPGWLSSLEE